MAKNGVTPMPEWTRIPAPIESETDRRALTAILVSAGLEVRIVRVRPTKGGAYHKHIEYRPQT